MTKKQWSSACQDDDFIIVHLYFSVFLTGLGFFSLKLFVRFLCLVWFVVAFCFVLFSVQFGKRMENILKKKKKKRKVLSILISKLKLDRLEIVSFVSSKDIYM